LAGVFLGALAAVFLAAVFFGGVFFAGGLLEVEPGHTLYEAFQERRHEELTAKMTGRQLAIGPFPAEGGLA